ncbi:hypothetical protein CDAR_493021 [Caerostris darwini]|uniref:Uncharacterized protein n=1 Tax=Caerostris darwini TaxID=1538125 RepID=A0AAV4MXI7_9ARAC|nr:hypothetical protein CDAR_493021 [Caerostris darwini]
MATDGADADLNLLIELDSSSGLAEDMPAARALFEHGTSTGKKFDDCALFKNPRIPSLKSVANPEISLLSSGEASFNEGDYDIKSIPKASDFYDDDDFQLMMSCSSNELEEMVHGSVKECVKHVFEIFVVYRSRFSSGLAFHQPYWNVCHDPVFQRPN